ncbi:5-oxoprolinase subunit PxpB [Desulfogranum mediterraneum]|uniref:5-oxoprolinase subunit PxpB n=1 Tax=Desulfogranum mediterraneum TaxID=160661 RepID=UPI0004139FB3|nr:5-oxoprolinase subunit PxpB [Desulfogranum mediterraneum]
MSRPSPQGGLYPEPIFRPAGDRGMLMELGTGIDPEINQKIRGLSLVLERTRLQGVVEIIPGYRSLAVIYDPLQTKPETLRQALLALYDELEHTALPEARVVELPVCYGGEFGEDLARVAAHNRLSPAEVVAIHSAPLYPVYMIGFTPGFPYLGGLSEKIHTPRLATPRTLVPAGSVGIANSQTGIYPIASPGGWQLIGRCPCPLFDPGHDRPFLLKAGDLLRFSPISRDEYLRLRGEQRK